MHNVTPDESINFRPQQMKEENPHVTLNSMMLFPSEQGNVEFMRVDS